jgi:CHAD domain-containing protein
VTSPGRTLHIEADERVDRASKRILLAELDEAARLARDRSVAADERVHDVRVGLKRARAVLALVAEEAGPPARRDNRALRKAARLLGPARDRAVAAEALARFTKALDRRRGGAARGRSALRRRLDGALARVDEERVLEDAARELERARRAVGRWRVRGGRRVARAGFEAAYRRARRAFRAVDGADDPARFHELRKAVKRLHYEVDLLALRAPGASASGGRLKRLGRMLGELHDLAVLRALVADVDEGDGAERDALLALVEGRLGVLRRAARARGAALFAERPSVVGRRVEAAWLRRA